MRDPCNMPGRLDEWIRDNLSLNLDDDCSLDDMDFYSGPTEDIWKKFDIGVPADFPNYEEQCEIWDTYGSGFVGGGSSGFQVNCSSSVAGEIRNHDCMWAGHCLSKEHDRTNSPPPPHLVHPIQMVKPPVINANSVLINSQQKLVTVQKSALFSTPSPVKPRYQQRTVKCERKFGSDNLPTSIITTNNGRTGVIVQKTVGRSLLLNSRTNSNNHNNNNSNSNNNKINNTHLSTTVVKHEFVNPQRRSLESNGDSPRPETPQSLSGDDEYPIPIDHGNPTSVFRNALDVMLSQTAVPDDWDEELLINFGDVKRTKPVVQTQSNVDLSRISASAQSDHNYDGSNKIRTEGLGVQTPSDSEEEEIDVVTLTERTGNSRSSSTSSSGSGLPTKPSLADQKQLQEITTSKLLSASKAVSRKLKFAAKNVSVSSSSSLMHGKRKKSYSTTDDDSAEYTTKITRYNKRVKNHHGARRKYRSRFSTDSEPESREKRSLHNSMERMRRIDLRNSFEELRVLVPSLANKERAAKVVILRDAAVYCSDLGTQSRVMKNEVEALQREQMRLRSVVSSLRKAAAVCVKQQQQQHVHKKKKSVRCK